jgi:hypothetical protein
MRFLAISLLLLGLAAITFNRTDAIANDVDRVQENQKLRDEAKSIVQRAYEQSKVFCQMYPSAEHTVDIVDSDGERLTVTVKCETVNSYFNGKAK